MRRVAKRNRHCVRQEGDEPLGLSRTEYQSEPIVKQKVHPAAIKRGCLHERHPASFHDDIVVLERAGEADLGLGQLGI
jgi:hypothetical protein